MLINIRYYFLFERKFDGCGLTGNAESELECALCDSKCRHRVASKQRWPFKPIPQHESIQNLLQEVGNFDGCLTVDSLACNKCYMFCQRLLQQCGEDLCPPASIVHALGNLMSSRIGSNSVAMPVIIMRLHCCT